MQLNNFVDLSQRYISCVKRIHHHKKKRRIDDDIRQRHTRHMDKEVMDQVYTLLPPKFRAQFYRESFLTLTKQLISVYFLVKKYFSNAPG